MRKNLIPILLGVVKFFAMICFTACGLSDDEYHDSGVCSHCNGSGKTSYGSECRWCDGKGYWAY